MMMTPDSISNKHFDKGMGGYRQDEVDDFLDQVAAEFRALQSEKAELEQKIEVLAQKIDQYREDEDSLRSALIGAQKLGDSVIRESKAKAEMILREANGQAAKILEDVQKDVQIEQTALTQMKKEVTKFKNRLLSMYRQHLDLITSLPDYSVKHEVVEEEPAFAPSFEETVAESVSVPQPLQEPAEEPASKEQDIELDFSGMDTVEETASSMSFAEVPTPTPDAASKFGQLKFGEGFDVERDDAKKNSVFTRKKHR